MPENVSPLGNSIENPLARTTALPLRAPSTSNSWRYLGDNCLRVTKRSWTKVTAVSSHKGAGGNTPKNLPNADGL